MTQEGNILITPFYTTFPQLEGKTEFFIASPERKRLFWIRFENDKLKVWSPAANCSNIFIQRRALSDVVCLYVAYQPESNGNLINSQVEVYARDWLDLAEKLHYDRSRYFQEPFLNLMRQIGGDPVYAACFTLSDERDDDD